MAHLPCSNPGPFITYICFTTGLHLGPLPSTPFFYLVTLPSHPPPSDLLTFLLSQLFTFINTPTISSLLFLLFKQHMKMEQTQGVPKCQHRKFICWGITQKKEYNTNQLVQNILGVVCSSYNWNKWLYQMVKSVWSVNNSHTSDYKDCIIQLCLE
jgi:hypothetical protein